MDYLACRYRIAVQVSRTMLRSQRCAGSESIWGCQSIETVISDRREWKGKTMHVGAQISSVAFGNAGIGTLLLALTLIFYALAMTLGRGHFGSLNVALLTSVMADTQPDQRGVISGMLNLARNLGLITGASVMGAVFAFASMTTDITPTLPDAVATGRQITFVIAAILIAVTLVISILSRILTRHTVTSK